MDFIKSNRKSKYLNLRLVVFEVSFDYLCISIATADYETSFTTKTPQISGGSTKFAIDLDDFVNLLKSKCDDITIQKDGDKITVNNGGVNIELQDMSHGIQEFPWDKSKPKSFVISNAKQIFKSVDKFVGKDELRPAMKGMFFNLTDGVLKTCTTDANKLMHTVQEGVDGDDTQFTMRLDIIKSVQKVLETDFDGEVVCIVYKEMVSVWVGRYIFTSRVIDYNYPDYTVVLPRENNFAVQLNKETLISAIENISPSTDKDKKKILFTFYKDKLVIFGWDENNNRKAFIEIPFLSSKVFNSNEDGVGVWTEDQIPFNNIGMNFEFVLDILDTVVGETVTITFDSPSRAVLFSTPEDGIQQPILCMPIMKLADEKIPNPKEATEEQIEALINGFNDTNKHDLVLDKSFFPLLFDNFPINERLAFLFWGEGTDFSENCGWLVQQVVAAFFGEYKLKMENEPADYMNKIFGGWTLEAVKESYGIVNDVD